MSKAGKKSKRSFVLSIGDEGAILSCFEKRKMIKRMFVNAPSSTEYLDLLKSSPTSPIYVLVDIVDQAYIQHTMPPVSSMNVGKLVDRKLQRDFDDNDIKAAIKVGREKTGRKEWTFLFVSVRNAPPFSDWLDTLINLPNPFGGVYLLPLESIHYLNELQRVTLTDKNAKHSGWQILVSYNRVGGFRQVVFRNGKIIFTRIAQPIGGQTADVVAGNIEQETLNTIEYIRRLGYDDSEGLDIYVVVSSDVKAVLEINATPSSHTYVLTPFEIAEKLALDGAAEEKDRFGDVVAAALFITSKKKVLRLETPLSQRIKKLRSSAAIIKVAGIAAAAGLIVFTALNTMNYFNASESADKLSRDISQQKNSLEEARNIRQSFNRNPDLIRAIATGDTQLSAGADLPIDFVRKLSSTLGEEPIALASGLDITLGKKEYEQNYSLAASMKMELLNSNQESIDKTLDNIELLKSILAKSFPEYTIAYSNLPTDNIALVNGGNLNGLLAIDVSFNGPNPVPLGGQP